MAIATLTKLHSEIRRLSDLYDLVPVEMLPNIVDHAPSTLRLMTEGSAAKHMDYRLIPWEDFFAKFDVQRLICAFERENRRAELYQQELPSADEDITRAH